MNDELGAQNSHLDIGQNNSILEFNLSGLDRAVKDIEDLGDGLTQLYYNTTDSFSGILPDRSVFTWLWVVLVGIASIILCYGGFQVARLCCWGKGKKNLVHVTDV